MKRLLSLVMILGLSAVACGNNPCEDAVDKLDECNFDAMGQDIDADECDEEDECAAECVNDASCDDINNFSESFLACISKCSG